jgi:hypothetical protein
MWPPTVLVQRQMTPLLLACTGGHLTTAKWLVANAGCNARTDRNKVRGAVLLSCSPPPVVSSRVPARMLALRVLQNNETALLLAAANGHLEVLQWLVAEAGSDARLERNSVCGSALCSSSVALPHALWLCPSCRRCRNSSAL